VIPEIEFEENLSKNFNSYFTELDPNTGKNTLMFSLKNEKSRVKIFSRFMFDKNAAQI
jgi:hypothetical protein